MTIDKLFSRTALISSMLYAVFAVTMALSVHRLAEPEGAGFAFLIYGFPWSIAVASTNCFNLKESLCLPLVLILNAATVYVIVLAIVHVINDSK